jgi:hypothetical protein
VKSEPKPATQDAAPRRSVDKPALVGSATKDWLRSGPGQGRLVPAEAGREAVPVKE